MISMPKKSQALRAAVSKVASPGDIDKMEAALAQLEQLQVPNRRLTVNSALADIFVMSGELTLALADLAAPLNAKDFSSSVLASVASAEDGDEALKVIFFLRNALSRTLERAGFVYMVKENTNTSYPVSNNISNAGAK